MRYQFSPSSWVDGARAVDAATQDFATSAQSTLAGLANLSDVVGFGGSSADAAVAQILQSLNAAASRTVAGIASGLAMEADTMAVTGRAYEAVEQANESIASKAGN